MKKWYNSKTLWVNIVSGILVLIPSLNDEFFKALGIHNYNSYLTILATVNVLLNLILRMITNTAIEVKKAKK